MSAAQRVATMAPHARNAWPRSSRIRPANDRETSRHHRKGWSVESAGQELGFGQRRRSRDRPREHSQDGDTGSNPVGTTSGNASSESSSPPWSRCRRGLSGHGKAQVKHAEQPGAIRLSSRICPADEVTMSRRGSKITSLAAPGKSTAGRREDDQRDGRSNRVSSSALSSRSSGCPTVLCAPRSKG